MKITWKRHLSGLLIATDERGEDVGHINEFMFKNNGRGVARFREERKSFTSLVDAQAWFAAKVEAETKADG